MFLMLPEPVNSVYQELLNLLHTVLDAVIPVVLISPRYTMSDLLSSRGLFVVFSNTTPFDVFIVKVKPFSKV